MKGGQKTYIQGGGNWFTNLADRAKSAASGLASGVASAARGVASGVGNAATNAYGAVRDRVAGSEEEETGVDGV